MAVFKAICKSSKSNKVTKSNKPEAFSDSFTTTDACFSVEVKCPWGESVEDIEVKIDCGGSVHGDEDTIDLFIQMLEQARENLVARRGERYVTVRLTREQAQAASNACDLIRDHPGTTGGRDG